MDTPDAIPVGLNDYVVKGWCHSENAFDDIQIHVSLNGKQIPVFSGLPRPDIVKKFRNRAALRSGFLARIQSQKVTQTVIVTAQVDGLRIPLSKGIPIPVRGAAPSGLRAKAQSYQDWISRNEPQLFWSEAEISYRLSSLAYRPSFSIILPTYNTPEYFLTRCIQSVLDQHYNNWQLCIADDQSTDRSVFERLKRYADDEKRIYLQQCEYRGGISAASNLALNRANGDFIVLLDHDDELHPYALLEVARAANESANCKLFYSDEDKIDECGFRSQPAFKPDFDNNIFLTFNYLGHLIALKRSVAEEIGGFRSSCDGAQDWDLLIRATEAMDQSSIGHIRKPLYHWRMHPESTAQRLEAKPYASKAWTRVLEDHIQRTAAKVTVSEGLFFGSMRQKYPARKQIEVAVFLRPEDGVFQSSVIRINSRRRVLHLYQVIDSLVLELPQQTGMQVAAEDQIKERKSSPYSLADVKGDLFVFLNGTLESLNHLFFEELIAQGMRDDCGLVTGISLNFDGQLLATGFVRESGNELLDPYVGARLPTHGYMGQISVVRTIDACPDTFFAVRPELLAEVGGLGAVSSSHMQRLADALAMNARRKGLSVLFTPYAIATFSEEPKLQKVRQDFEHGQPSVFRLNPNLKSFEHFDDLLRGAPQ